MVDVLLLWRIEGGLCVVLRVISWVVGGGALWGCGFDLLLYSILPCLSLIWGWLFEFTVVRKLWS